VSDPSSVAGWFERAYATGRTPWATLSPDQRLVEWARDRPAGGWALVVGCGLGDDAVLLAGLGWEVVAFDVSRSAIQSARGRFPGSQITYLVADLLLPPSAWRAAFSLVVEVRNLQSLTRSVRPRALASLAALVAPGGTVFLAGVGGPRIPPQSLGMPAPVTRDELDLLGRHGLERTEATWVPRDDGTSSFAETWSRSRHG
jgi:SAM-dependent methyltransferase